jgi:hypothetical protein
MCHTNCKLTVRSIAATQLRRSHSHCSPCPFNLLLLHYALLTGIDATLFSNIRACSCMPLMQSTVGRKACRGAVPFDAPSIRGLCRRPFHWCCLSKEDAAALQAVNAPISWSAKLGNTVISDVATLSPPGLARYEYSLGRKSRTQAVDCASLRSCFAEVRCRSELCYHLLAFAGVVRHRGLRGPAPDPTCG